MTVSVKISVNGNYKLPITYKQGDREENHIVSGRGLDRPNELSVPFYHSADIMTLQLGPETPDTGEEQPEHREATFGQKAVGLTFNPGGRTDVDACKRGFAAEIDRMNNLRESATNPEQKRLASVAITELQGAQMWAVKALTWNS